MKKPSQETHTLFLELYETFSDEIFRFCLSKTRNRDLSLDITQETFIKTWDYLRTGKEIEMKRAFLYRTCRNLIIDHSRKKRADSLDVIMETQPVSDDEHAGITSIPTGTTIDRQQVLERLKRLPEQHYEILMLRFIQELTLSEIAKIYKESENTISVRIHRATKYAQQLFQPEERENYEL